MRISDWSSDVCSSDLLLREGVPSTAVHVTGNTGIDHLFHAMALPDLTDVAGRPLQSLGGRRFGVATIHRRENRGERLAGIATGLGRVSRDFDLPIILPLHPAPELRPLQTLLEGEQVGRASCRERGWQYG